MRADPARQEEDPEAYEGWQKQFQATHRLFLGGDPSSPPQPKGLRNREARSKERYRAGRVALLGLGGGEDDPISSVG